MNKKLPAIDRLFKNALDDHTEPLPENVWNNLSNYLDKKQTVALQKKYTRLKRKFVTLLFITTTAGIYSLYDYTTQKWNAGTKEVRQELKKSAAVTNLRKVLVLKTGLKPEPPLASVSTITKARKQDKTTTTTERSTTLLLKSNFFKSPYALRMPNNDAGAKRAATQLAQSYVANQSGFQQSGISGTLSAAWQKSESALLPQSGRPLLQRIITASSSTTAVSKPKHESRFSVTLFYAPDLALDRLDDLDKNDPPYLYETNREQYASSFHTGFLVNYNLTKNWSLQSGLSFSNFSTTIQPKTIFAHADNQGDVKYKLHCSAGNSYIVPKSGVVEGDSAQTLNTQTRLQYLSVPLTINYGVQRGNFRFTTGLGVAANWLLEGKIKTSIRRGAQVEDYENDISGLKPVHLNGLVSLGIEYRLAKNIWLNLTPISRLALHSINDEIPVKSYQNFLSVATGLRTNF